MIHFEFDDEGNLKILDYGLDGSLDTTIISPVEVLQLKKLLDTKVYPKD